MVDAAGSKARAQQEKLGNVGLEQPYPLREVRQFRADIVNILGDKRVAADWDPYSTTVPSFSEKRGISSNAWSAQEAPGPNPLALQKVELQAAMW